MLSEIARLARGRWTIRFDYSDRRQEASQRRVEPYRIVNAGQRWYLVAWDLDRDDWRTFRVDRMREGMSPGMRFRPREISDAEVEALVARGVPPEARRHQARVIVHAPAAQLLERFGPWLGTVTPIDDTTCAIDTGADSVEQLAAWLGTLGADFQVTEPPELVEAVRSLAGRFAAASAQDPPPR
jgi:predicted DNA-binding transcriptional regulator YafY